MIIRNEYFYPDKIKPEEINRVFDEFDRKYAYMEAEEDLFPKGWPAEEGKEAHKMDVNAGSITDMKVTEFSQEKSIFLEETPAEKTEVSRAILEMIRKAEKNIKII